MELKIEKMEDQTTINIVGRLDTINAGSFLQQVEALPDSDMTDVLIDCIDLEYISSSGLRAFISILKRAQKNGGTVKVLNLNNNVKEVFDMTGFSALFGL